MLFGPSVCAMGRLRWLLPWVRDLLGPPEGVDLKKQPSSQAGEGMVARIDAVLSRTRSSPPERRALVWRECRTRDRDGKIRRGLWCRWGGSLTAAGDGALFHVVVTAPWSCSTTLEVVT